MLDGSERIRTPRLAPLTSQVTARGGGAAGVLASLSDIR